MTLYESLNELTDKNIQVIFHNENGMMVSNTKVIAVCELLGVIYLNIEGGCVMIGRNAEFENLAGVISIGKESSAIEIKRI